MSYRNKETGIWVETAYTEAQRNWYLAAYDYQCAFPMSSNDRYKYGFVLCGKKAGFNIWGKWKPLYVHHIKPRSVLKVEYPLLDPNDPGTTPAIVLCFDHHYGVLHRNMKQAGIDYYHGDKDAYKKASMEDHERALAGLPPHNSTFDDQLLYIAQNTFDEYHASYPYPRDESWEETKLERRRKGARGPWGTIYRMVFGGDDTSGNGNGYHNGGWYNGEFGEENEH